MKEKRRKYSMTQCALYRCSTKRKLAERLHLTREDLRDIDSWMEYHSFSVSKKDGEPRPITAPNEQLKALQKRILKLFARVERPEWLISGEKGKSYIDNGKYHLSSHYFLTVDIKKFYENCKREYVYRFFIDSLCVSSDVAEILTNIVTLEKRVPTGCPTSQIIAYYAYQEMFKEIHILAQRHGCKFSLYVDDMTFSSVSPFNPNLLSNDIDKLLRKYGHKPKYSKVKYFPKNSHKLVTGVVVSKDHELLVANSLRKKIYFDAMEQIDSLNTGLRIYKSTDRICTLKGRLQAAKSVNSKIFPEINRVVDKLWLSQDLDTPNLSRAIPGKVKARRKKVLMQVRQLPRLGL